MNAKERRKELIPLITKLLALNPNCQIKLLKKDYDLFAGEEFYKWRENLKLLEKR